MIDEKELQREETFWDAVGAKWTREKSLEDLRVVDPRQFLSGSSVAFEDFLRQLGDANGKKILDYGCGSGWLSTYLAQRGALVEGFDISGNLVALGMKRANANGVGEAVRLQRMIAERLDYPSNTFDVAAGISIIHHIALEEGSRELLRVLKPGGVALFIEPLGESKIVNEIRNRIFRVHHGERRELDAEHPLTYEDIRRFGAGFSKTEFREFQLTEMVARVLGDRLTGRIGLRRLDQFLLKRFPRLRKFCRLVVIRYQK